MILSVFRSVQAVVLALTVILPDSVGVFAGHYSESTRFNSTFFESQTLANAALSPLHPLSGTTAVDWRQDLSDRAPQNRLDNSRIAVEEARQLLLDGKTREARQLIQDVLNGNDARGFPSLRISLSRIKENRELGWMLETASLSQSALQLEKDIAWVQRSWEPHLQELGKERWRPLDWANSTLRWFQADPSVSADSREAVIRSILRVLEKTTYTYGLDLNRWISILAFCDAEDSLLPDEGSARIRAQFERLYEKKIVSDCLWEEYLDYVIQEMDYPRLKKFISYAHRNVLYRWQNFLKKPDPDSQRMADRLFAMLVGLYTDESQKNIHTILLSRHQGNPVSLINNLQRLIAQLRRNHEASAEWFSRASEVVDYYQDKLHLPPLLWKGPPHMQYVFEGKKRHFLVPFPVRAFSVEIENRTIVFWLAEDGRWVMQGADRQDKTYAPRETVLVTTNSRQAEVLRISLLPGRVEFNYRGETIPVVIQFSPPYRNALPRWKTVERNLELLNLTAVPIEGWYLFDRDGNLLIREEQFAEQAISNTDAEENPGIHLVHARVDRDGVEIIDVFRILQQQVSAGFEWVLVNGPDEYWAHPDAVESLRQAWLNHYRPSSPAMVENSAAGREIARLLRHFPIGSAEHEMAQLIFNERAPALETLEQVLVPLQVAGKRWVRPAGVRPAAHARFVIDQIVQNWWNAHSSWMQNQLKPSDLSDQLQPLKEFLQKKWRRRQWFPTFTNIPYHLQRELIRLHQAYNRPRWEMYKRHILRQNS